MDNVRFCPFCGQEALDCVAKQTIKASVDSPEPDEVICTYCCEDCGGMFTVKVYNIDGILKSDENSEACTTCTDDFEDQYYGSASFWRDEADRYHRELEKTRWLLDLAAKEGMRRE